MLTPFLVKHVCLLVRSYASENFEYGTPPVSGQAAHETRCLVLFSGDPSGGLDGRHSLQGAVHVTGVLFRPSPRRGVSSLFRSLDELVVWLMEMQTGLLSSGLSVLGVKQRVEQATHIPPHMQV